MSHWIDSDEDDRRPRMKWTRVRIGAYSSGPYTVERVLGNAWRAHGPGMNPEVIWHTKVLAQDECRRAAERRAADLTCTPVVGDVVTVNDNYGPHRRGTVTAIVEAAHHRNPEDRTLYCITFARSRKLCLFRREIQLVIS